jgi:small subunit ribosomal protein S1
MLILAILCIVAVFFIIDFNSKRAAVIEATHSRRESLRKSLYDGQILDGVVKKITGNGALIDLGGMDGFLHITDISWEGVKHPSELLTVGQNVRVKVLDFDDKRKHVFLGMKQLSDDPRIF